jgi:hypothetical protein
MAPAFDTVGTQGRFLKGLATNAHGYPDRRLSTCRFVQANAKALRPIAHSCAPERLSLDRRRRVASRGIDGETMKQLSSMDFDELLSLKQKS